MSDAPRSDEAPQEPARRKPRPRKRKAARRKPPADVDISVSSICGMTRYFDTDEGGRLRVDRGEVALSFRLRRNAYIGEGEPVDTASCFVRLADEAGQVWEAESIFPLDVFIEHMIDLGRMSWLVYFEDAEEWKGAFDGDCLMTGATCLLDDRFYRKFLVEDDRVELQFKYQCPTFDVAFFRSPYVTSLTRLIVRVSGLYDSEMNEIRPLAFEMNWSDLLFRNELYFDVAEGAWMGDGWPLPVVFRKAGSSRHPNPSSGMRRGRGASPVSADSGRAIPDAVST